MTQSIGIAFLIRYRCNYKGRKSAEFNLYFSDKPIAIDQLDWVTPGQHDDVGRL